MPVDGNEWAKRQAAKARIGFEPLDNGFAACEDVPAVQRICDSLGPTHIDALLRKWLRILPNPFTDDDETAGYRYELSVLQAEFSLTQMLNRPVSGRIFFEQVLHDNLDIGRPDQISLIFDRRIRTRGRHPTPSRFRTRVITDGVIPSLHIDYKAHQDQAVPQGRESIADRNHDQRHPRLRIGLAEITDPDPQPHPDCGPPTAHTRPPSTNSPTTPTSPPDTNRRLTRRPRN